MSKILILCTGNSCRSIMVEGLINATFKNIEAFSSGVAPSGKVNPNAKKILELNQAWKDKYHSKKLDEVIAIDFDLIITVCDGAKESCPTFPKKVKQVHIGFEDPDGKELQEFEKIWEEMKERIIPFIKNEFES